MTSEATISIATLNIGAASKGRAARIVEEWVAASDHDVYVFTETTNGEGTDLIASAFATAGWKVFRERLPERERGVLIAARIAAVRIDGPVDDPAPGRTVFIELSSEPRVVVAGMYVPSRDATVRQIRRTEEFLAFWCRSLTAMASHPHRILAGDLNVVPPDQHPSIFPQLDFEDRWFASLEHAAGFVDPVRVRGLLHEFTWRARRSDEGYTYDYVLASRALIPRVVNTSYDHTVRMTRGLSDHSAVALSLKLDKVSLRAPRPQQHVRQGSLF
jgi:exodeoxyribonuclease-3